MMLDLASYWYRQKVHPLLWLLVPFALLFRIVTTLRRVFYRSGILASYQVSVPVIVVGNITVGGTGKTPFVIWLAQQLALQGYQPGIVSRGVGGRKHKAPHLVQQNDAPAFVGDEALLMMRRADCPVVIAVDRVAAARELTALGCNVIISDDGLQHYRLIRDIEIAIVDGARRFGNGWVLPAGPLREPVSRLDAVDFVVVNGGDRDDTYVMTLESAALTAVTNSKQEMSFMELPSNTVHAVAGIGHPARFFKQLEDTGLKVIPHVFPDHYLYQAADFNFNDTLPILMTEKDAVKCETFADQRFWWLRVKTIVTPELMHKLLARIKSGERNDTEADFSRRTCDLAKRQPWSNRSSRRES
jgi:tetraacyldisaccharide 4'-kinase